MKLFEKERVVTDLVKSYLATMESCVDSAREAVVAHLAGDTALVAELFERVGQLESDADEFRRDIEGKLFSGAYLPLIRGDICSIVESLDRVPNAAESCCSFFHCEKPDIPPDLKDAFLRISNDSFATVSELREAARAFFRKKGKIGDIREHARRVGVAESAVDTAENELGLRIFASPELDLAGRMHVKRALERITQISDRAENAAEKLVMAAMKAVL